MPDILSITAPLYLLMALGFVAARQAWLDAADARVIGQFVVRFALPALLFRMVASRQLAEVLHGRFLLAYAAGSLVAFGLGWWWARRHPASRRALTGMGMACSNTGFIGTPVLLSWMGPGAGTALALVLMVENLLMMPLMFSLAERERAQGQGAWAQLRAALAPLRRQPIVWAIVAGLMCSALGLALPAAAGRAIDLLGQGAAGAALVVIGAALASLRRGGLEPDMAVVALGKLLVHPLAVAAALWLLLPDDPRLRSAGIVLAASPMFSIYPVLAQRYGLEGFAAAALLLSTSLSFVTISSLLWWLSGG